MEKSKSTRTYLKNCLNLSCKEVMKQAKNGWRLRSGDFAGLCHTCGSAYEEGKFCETFHLSASGWRCCETCGKQIHCGCIVSFHMFVLLDAGGIECLTCARKSLIMTPNPARPSSHPDRIKDLSGKNWSTMAGSGPVPWRKAPSLFSGYSKKEQAKASLEFDVPSGTDILHFSDKMSSFSFERQNNEDSVKRLSSEKTCGPDILENIFSAVNSEARSNAFAIGSNCTVLIKDKTDGNLNMATVSVPKNKSADTSAASTRALISSNHSGLDVSTDNQVHSGKSKGDARGTSHSLARYSPQITDQERIQISGEYPNIISKRFFCAPAGSFFIFDLKSYNYSFVRETLTASDAGRTGRLIIPKRCAEAYLPSISHSDGLSLEVGDSKGNEWLLQFRFWSNIHSRMYVLEGVTPCIQSLQLQAGDIVTFSRLEPEGKLMIGGRKALATTSTDQEVEDVTMIDGMSANGVNMKKCSKQSETDLTSINKPEVVSNRPKRKRSILASTSKRSMIENGYMTKLKLTLKEAQGLIRPPPGNNPKVIVIEGCELEEYEDVPIIGRPSILSSDYTGKEIQWVQCDDCLKWRKVPTNTLLPSKWTCSANSWDQEKSMCSAAPEWTAEHLTDLFPAISYASSKTSRVSKPDSDSVKTLEALNALANMALQEEGASLHASTRHPRHKPRCSCIVCMQPPSGKGPKHKQSCDCVVCESLKRRLRTLITRRLEKKQPERDAGMTLQKLVKDTDVDLLGELLTGTANQDVVNHDGLKNDKDANEIFASPSNVKINLNSQPKRDKEFASESDILSMLDLIHEASGIHIEQQNQLCPTDEESLGGHDIHQKGLMGAMYNSCIAFDRSHETIDIDCQSALPADIVAASASTAQ